MSEYWPCRYALLLLELELSVLEVEVAMLDQEVADGQAEGASVVERLAKARTHAAEADSELQRLESEGPPNHRKRDPLDKVREICGARGRTGGSKLGEWVLQGVCWASRVSPSPSWENSICRVSAGCPGSALHQAGGNDSTPFSYRRCRNSLDRLSQAPSFPRSLCGKKLISSRARVSTDT